MTPSQPGHSNEITAEMVERAALAIRNVEAAEHGHPAIDSLDRLHVPDYYRSQARAALTAAFR